MSECLSITVLYVFEYGIIFTVFWWSKDIFVNHLIIIIKSEVSIFPTVVIFFPVVVSMPEVAVHTVISYQLIHIDPRKTVICSSYCSYCILRCLRIISMHCGLKVVLACTLRYVKSWLGRLIIRRAGLLWSQQDFEWWWSVPLSSASLY